MITSTKLRRGPSNDNIDFIPVTGKADSFKSIGIGDKAFDDESNHAFLREELNALSIIPARNESVPIWRTKGKYRKEMKRGYSKKMYHQRSKVEAIFFVIKKTMLDDIMSIKTKAQNNEIRFKIIAYNAARIASLAYSLFVGFLQGLRVKFYGFNAFSVSKRYELSIESKKSKRMLFCDRQNYQVVYLFRVQVFFFKVIQGLLDNFWTFLNVLHTRVFVVFSELQQNKIRVNRKLKHDPNVFMKHNERYVYAFSFFHYS